MDIKLRARLSAYSKIDSINSMTGNGSVLPTPSVDTANHILGINDSGNYTLFPSIQPEDIDTLFSTLTDENVVTKEDIDTLFSDEQDIQSVTKSEIDSLFDNTTNNSVELQDDQKTVVVAVSHADIDSLFD